MLTPGRVASRRIRADALFQYRAWRLAVDWTVALYIVVPALFFAGYQYMLWWQEPPFWMNGVPYGIVRSGFFLLAVSGTVRYYVEEADQLFLLQRVAWFRGVMAWGAGYSLGLHAGWTAFAGLWLYPLLARVYGMALSEVAALMLVVYLFKIYVMLGKQLLAMRFHGWKGFLARAFMLSAAGLSFGGLGLLSGQGLLAAAAVALGLALPLIWLLPARLRQKGAFYHDVRREQQEKMKVTGLLLGAGGIPAPQKPRLRRKRPLLFPGSGRLFRVRTAENVLAESLIKAVYRNSSKLNLMAYAVAAYSGAVAISPPGGYRWIVWLSVSALFVWMAKGFTKEAAFEPYIRLFHWQDGVRFEAFWKAGMGISLPGCLLLALMAGLFELGVWQMLLMLPAGAAASWAGSRVFGLWGA
jgi:ABC-2 type transport system permease protein